ncbi:chorismate synthase [Candidatus Vidania fulgoroideorum]
MSNTIGKFFKISTFGESHGNSLGCIIEGCPSGINFNKGYIQSFLNKRRPGKNKFVSLRNEEDKLKILSGVFKKKTTGTPIAIIVNNLNKRSIDYNNLISNFRPGHADFSYSKKYKVRDYRGGGRSSARTTISIVIAGALARIILKEIYNIKIFSYISSIGKKKFKFNYKIDKEFNIPLVDVKKAKKYINIVKKKLDSVGSVINLNILNLPFSIGEPLFMKIESEIFGLISSINAVKAIEIGSGLLCSKKNASENNDLFYKKGFLSNNSGGVLGGISNGQDLNFKVHIKPTSSIGINQKTINNNNKEINLKIVGRHDPCIGLRAIPIIEACACISIVDLIIINKLNSFF